MAARIFEERNYNVREDIDYGDVKGIDTFSGIL
jgi:hypothetical protein